MIFLNRKLVKVILLLETCPPNARLLQLEVSPALTYFQRRIEFLGMDTPDWARRACKLSKQKLM
jgi:hypothetical protein